MGGFLSPSPATSTSSGTSQTTYTPSANTMNEWGQIQGTMSGLVLGPNGIVNNYAYPGGANAMVAGPSDLTNQMWNMSGQVGGIGGAAPNVYPTVNNMQAASGDLYNTQVNPSGIGLPQFNASSFQPGQLNIPSFGATPNVSLSGNQPSGLASGYQYSPQQVQAPQAYTPQQISAMMVSAPGAVNPITGVENVNAPQLNQYQMQAAQNINAPTLENYSMTAAQNVAPSGLASTQSWTNPGTASQYMSPYTQQVVNTQLQQAQVQEQQQLQQQNAQAAQAGAFGGSRAAVEAANTSLGYQQQAQALEAQGLQSAYQTGTQQFNTEQGLGLQAQQTNIQAGLQAALANQQMQQQAGQANLQSQLTTQGLGTNAYMQAQLANQANQQQANVQNLSSFLQTQGLGAQTGMQAQLANQAMSDQVQAQNQQAQEFGLGQTMQASLANQQAGLTAQEANQQAGLQAGLANMQYQYGASQANAAAYNQMMGASQQLGQQGAEFTAGQGLQAGMANQAAAMQGLGMTYQGGLQGALQTQNLGLSGAEYGGQLGAQTAAQQYGLQQAQQGLNMGAIQNAANMQAQGQQLAMQGYQTGLAGTQAGYNMLTQGATSQQGYEQQLADAAYQNWYNGLMLPMQGVGALAGITAMQPVPYTMNNQYSGTTTSMPAEPSILGQVLGGVFGAAGATGQLLTGIGNLRKGGLVKKPHGLALVPRRPAARGGLGALTRAA